jgi:hypothetical protein
VENRGAEAGRESVPPHTRTLSPPPPSPSQTGCPRLLTALSTLEWGGLGGTDSKEKWGGQAREKRDHCFFEVGKR